MELTQLIKTTIRKYLNENQIEKIRNVGLLDQTDKIEGGFLNKKEAEDLQKEIESNYTEPFPLKINGVDTDIRNNLYNYNDPIAEKNINGVNLRIIQGLIEVDPFSNKKRKSYLLYADKKIIGKFYSVNDIKKVVSYIEDKLFKTLPKD